MIFKALKFGIKSGFWLGLIIGLFSSISILMNEGLDKIVLAEALGTLISAIVSSVIICGVLAVVIRKWIFRVFWE